MTRLPGRPLSESWPELSPAQREVVIRQLATFTNHLSSVGTSSEGDEDGEAAPGSWPAVGSLLVRGDCQTFSPLEAMNDRTLHLDLELAPLLLPKRHGANNLRPVTLEVRCCLTFDLAHPVDYSSRYSRNILSLLRPPQYSSMVTRTRTITSRAMRSCCRSLRHPQAATAPSSSPPVVQNRKVRPLPWSSRARTGWRGSRPACQTLSSSRCVAPPTPASRLIQTNAHTFLYCSG